MNNRKRPICVTVISWAWIIFGSIISVNAAVLLLLSDKMGGQSSDPEIITKILPYLAFVQLCITVLGLVSGINLLKLKAWSRKILEILTWFELLFFSSFLIYPFVHGVSLALQGGSYRLIFLSLGLLGFYGVPFGTMLIYLRGSKVKNAIAGVPKESN